MEREGSFELISINVSQKKGTLKKPVPSVTLVAEHGIQGDAHAGPWHRQVSLLAEEDIDTMRGKGLELHFGDFAENMTTRGVDLAALPVGTALSMGAARLEVTQIGKECHGPSCEVARIIGDCVMPRKGIFARVLVGGEVAPGCVCAFRLP